MKRLLTLTLLVLFVLTVSPGSVQEIPFLTGRVVDNAQILSGKSVELLSDSLKIHEMRTTNQVVVLTIPSLQGENIEDYANKVFNEWKLDKR